MTTSTLDKWIEDEPEPSKYTYIFINVKELNYVFEGQDKIVNYKKLLQWLKDLYGNYLRPILYMGVYDKECINSKARKNQEDQIKYLTNLGYYVKNCVKYHKPTGELVEKGSEVSMAIDLMHYGHPIDNRYDKAVVLCNESTKYRNIFNIVHSTLGKKLKVYSFSQEYENHYQDFMNFIHQVGIEQRLPSKKQAEIHYEKPFNYSNVIGMLNQNTLRDRLTPVLSEIKEKVQTYMFIDYGNIHHSFKDLKRIDKTLNIHSESDLIIKLKNKAQKYNKLMGVIMYMGMPQMNITQLQNLRKKNEHMKATLEKHGIKVRFKYNENLYKGGMKEHGVDLSIGYTIIEKALEDSFQKAILISGDADFVPVVTKLHELHKHVEIWAFTKPENNCALSPFLIYVSI